MELAGVSMGRCSELYCSIALSRTAPVPTWHRREISVTKSRTDRPRPHSPNDRRHQGKQLLCEDRIGRAVTGLAHHVSAEWRGAQSSAAPG